MDAQKNIELRSEKVRNIMGRIPSYFTRYGICIIAIAIILSLGVCYYIPYNESITGAVELRTIPQSKVYYSQSGGIINDYIEGDDFVLINKGDTLAEIYANDGNNFLVAESSGLYKSNIRTSNEYVDKGEILYLYMPELIDEALGFMFLPKSSFNDLKSGQKVLIELNEYPYELYGKLFGKVSKIDDSVYYDPNGESLLKVTVNLPYPLSTDKGAIISYSPIIKGRGKISVRESSLLKMMLKF